MIAFDATPFESGPTAFHPFPAVTPLADRAQKLPLGGWLNEGRLAVILQRKLPFRTRQLCGDPRRLAQGHFKPGAIIRAMKDERPIAPEDCHPGP